jgi:hypothetical protein
VVHRSSFYSFDANDPVGQRYIAEGGRTELSGIRIIEP